MDERFLEELEVLQSIYSDELTVIDNKRQHSITITLHPATADNKDARYVCMTLEMLLNDKYPMVIPEIHVKNPRGVSEAHVNSIVENAYALAKQKLGEPMLFELIEYAKDCLTNNNRPNCTCTICLEHFSDNDAFTKTDCYHYFHTCCLRRYVDASIEGEKDKEATQPTEVETSTKQLFCPVCRLPINVDTSKLLPCKSSERESDEITFVPDETYLSWREKVKVLYERQMRAGGIIDVEAQRNRFLLEIAETPTIQSFATSLSLKQDDEALTGSTGKSLVPGNTMPIEEGSAVALSQSPLLCNKREEAIYSKQKGISVPASDTRTSTCIKASGRGRSNPSNRNRYRRCREGHSNASGLMRKPRGAPTFSDDVERKQNRAYGKFGEEKRYGKVVELYPARNFSVTDRVKGDDLEGKETEHEDRNIHRSPGQSHSRRSGNHRYVHGSAQPKEPTEAKEGQFSANAKYKKEMTSGDMKKCNPILTQSKVQKSLRRDAGVTSRTVQSTPPPGFERLSTSQDSGVEMYL